MFNGSVPEGSKPGKHTGAHACCGLNPSTYLCWLAVYFCLQDPLWWQWHLWIRMIQKLPMGCCDTRSSPRIPRAPPPTCSPLTTRRVTSSLWQRASIGRFVCLGGHFVGLIPKPTWSSCFSVVWLSVQSAVGRQLVASYLASEDPTECSAMLFTTVVLKGFVHRLENQASYFLKVSCVSSRGNHMHLYMLYTQLETPESTSIDPTNPRRILHLFVKVPFVIQVLKIILFKKMKH